MKSSFIYMFLMLTVLVSCKSSAQPTGGNRFEKSMISLEKQECYGTCPVYSITIYGTGKMVYEGKRFVKKEGKFEKQLSFKEVNELFNAYECANFFEFENEYDEPDLQDLPTTYVTFEHRGVQKKIKDYYNAPAELKKLEKLVEDIVDSPEGWKPLN